MLSSQYFLPQDCWATTGGPRETIAFTPNRVLLVALFYSDTTE